MSNLGDKSHYDGAGHKCLNKMAFLTSPLQSRQANHSTGQKLYLITLKIHVSAAAVHVFISIGFFCFSTVYMCTLGFSEYETQGVQTKLQYFTLGLDITLHLMKKDQLLIFAWSPSSLKIHMSSIADVPSEIFNFMYKTGSSRQL